MLEKFLKTLKINHMIKKGEGIVIGVSGGPDSISLLHLFSRIREEYKLNLYAVHLNHQFRGKEAQLDADYVKEFCEGLDVKSFIFSENVALYSQEKGITFEEAGREIRYRLFHQIMKETGSHKIAVAQNLDDQAETVLMRLMRGTGLDGLGAIDYVRDHRIIRPMLDISRREIEDYCRENHLMPRIDKTNLESIYTRNRIRLELIPYIEKHFNANIKETLTRTANLLREENHFINDFAVKAYKRLAKQTESEIRINIKEFRKEHSAIKKRIIREGIRKLTGDLKNVQNKHIEKLIGFIEDGRSSGEMDLPKELYAFLEYDHFCIRKRKREIEKYDFEYTINAGEKLDIVQLNASLICQVVDMHGIRAIDRDQYEACFDLDKVKNNLILRNRKAGDRFTPFGMKGSKKLKDYFIDEKVPRQKRDKVPLLCDGNEIMWIIGYRISEKYRVDKDTEKVLMVTYKPKQKE